MEKEKTQIEVLEEELGRLKSMVNDVLSETLVMKIIQEKGKSYSPCKRAAAIREAEDRIKVSYQKAKAKEQAQKAKEDVMTKPQVSEWINQNLLH